MDKKNNKIQIDYEPEADVLSWEVSGESIDHAEEVGNVIVHFSKEHIPVFIELLEASKFFVKTRRLIEKQKSVRIPA